MSDCPLVSLRKPSSIAPWLGISLIPPLYFGILSWLHATASEVIIQDDARLHLVWLQRWIHPELFPADVIARYYTAIQPVGFKAFYGLVAALGLSPLAVAKLVPIGLAIIATIYLFQVTQLILPAPLSGVFTTLIFNQNVWLKDDLISATPRAFVYPIVAAFLYYLLRGAMLPCLLTLGLQGLFYPQMMLVSVGVLTLRLIHWQGRSPSLSPRLRDYGIWLLAIGLTVGMLLLFSHQVGQQVGRLVTLDEMKTMPEFQPQGRRAYFGVPFWQFLFAGASGLRVPLFPPIIGLGVLLPFAIWKSWSPLVTRLTPHLQVLPQLLLSALGLFGLAHLLFPALYLPSRYTFYSGRLLLSIATGLMLTLLAERGWNWLQQRRHLSQWTGSDRLKVGGIGLLGVAVIGIPAIPAVFLPCQGWVVGQTPAIYQQLAALPSDTLVASLVPEVNNIPAFAQRSVLVGEELALPYHVNFYQTMLQRLTNLVQAQYSSDPGIVRSFIHTYGIDIWLVDQSFADSTYLPQQPWLMHSSIRELVTTTTHQLEQGRQPVLAQIAPACTLLTENHLLVLDAHCIARSVQEPV